MHSARTQAGTACERSEISVFPQISHCGLQRGLSPAPKGPRDPPSGSASAGPQGSSLPSPVLVFLKARALRPEALATGTGAAVQAEGLQPWGHVRSPDSEPGARFEVLGRRLSILGLRVADPCRLPAGALPSQAAAFSGRGCWLRPVRVLVWIRQAAKGVGRCVQGAGVGEMDCPGKNEVKDEAASEEGLSI